MIDKRTGGVKVTFKNTVRMLTRFLDHEFPNTAMWVTPIGKDGISVVWRDGPDRPFVRRRMVPFVGPVFLESVKHTIYTWVQPNGLMSYAGFLPEPPRKHPGHYIADPPSANCSLVIFEIAVELHRFYSKEALVFVLEAFRDRYGLEAPIESLVEPVCKLPDGKWAYGIRGDVNSDVLIRMMSDIDKVFLPSSA